MVLLRKVETTALDGIQSRNQKRRIRGHHGPVQDVEVYHIEYHGLLDNPDGESTSFLDQGSCQVLWAPNDFLKKR